MSASSIASRPASPAVTFRTVLLLLDHAAASTNAIERAIRVSDALDAHLHVVLTIPAQTSTAHPMLAVRHALYVLGKHRVRRGISPEILRGTITELGPIVARDVDAQLVVVHPRFGAREACRLADTLRRPVLVARTPRRNGEWIAASDMRRSRFPVLATARHLARFLDRDVVYFHNIPRGDGVAPPEQARLADLVGTDRRVRSIVTRGEDTIGVLLDLARGRDADAIVVGHRRHSWLASMLGIDTAEIVVEHSLRSVLVVPLPGGA